MRHKVLTMALVLFAVLALSPLSNSHSVSAQENSICGWAASTSDTGAFSPAITIWGTNELLNLPTYPVDLMNIGLPGLFRIYDPVFQEKSSLQGDKYRVITSFSRIENVSDCEVFPQSVKENNSKSNELTATGFYWPTGKDLKSIKNNYLASGCNGDGDYFDDNYHIGVDIPAAIDTPVHAIADGEVFDISNRISSGWGLTKNIPNAAVLIKHKLSDGSSFIAIYGHLQNSTLSVSKIGEKRVVKANQIIGTIGDYGNSDHLHFGIFVGDTIKDSDHYGMLPCPKSGPITQKNGTEDPINWIITKYPENDNESTSVCDETWNDLSQVRPILVPVLLDTVLPNGNLSLSSAGGFSNVACADFLFRGYGINIMQKGKMVGDINITQYASREIALVNSGVENGKKEIWYKENGKWFYHTTACDSEIEFNLDENMIAALEVIVSNNVENYRSAACNLP